MLVNDGKILVMFILDINPEQLAANIKLGMPEITKRRCYNTNNSNHFHPQAFDTNSIYAIIQLIYYININILYIVYRLYNNVY